MKYFESCVFMGCIKKINQGYLVIEQKIYFIYLNSFTHWLIEKIVESIKIGFKFSIFGYLTELEWDISRVFFETSKARETVINCLRKLMDRINGYSITSGFFASIRSLKYKFFSYPFKVGGIIIITTITTNLTLSFILQRQIILWSRLMHGLFLFVGINGLFCDAQWEDIKRTSFLLTKIMQ